MVLEVYLFPGLQKIRNLILFVICETIFIPWKISLTYVISLLGLFSFRRNGNRTIVVRESKRGANLI